MSFRCAPWAPLVFVALVPLLVAAFRGVRAAAVAGAVAGMVGYATVLVGMPQVLVRFHAMPVLQAWCLFAAGVIYHALQFVLFAVGVAVITLPWGRRRAGYARAQHALIVILGVAALWVLLERVYPKVFPWSLGGVLATHRLLRQAADIGGVYGLGFAIAFINAAVALAFHLPRSSPIRRLAWAAALSVVCAMTAYGHWRIVSEDVSTAQPVGFTVVQGALPTDHAYGETAALGAWDTYERLTNRLVASSLGRDGMRPEVIVWPESTLPVYLRHDDWYREHVQRLVTSTDQSLIVGALDRPDGRPGVFNSAYAFVPPRGARAGVFGWNHTQVYHKSYLVPWAEYVPDGGWLRFLGSWRTTGEFIAGEDRDLFTVGRAVPGSSLLRIAPSICIEGLQAGWFNPLVRAGADVLLNITDDGWFAGSAVPDLHLQLTRMRAVETRRWLVRASNSGISAVIDPTGEIVASLPFGDVGTLSSTIVPSAVITPYVRFGNWIIPVSAGIVIAQLTSQLKWARWRRLTVATRRSSLTDD